MFILKVKIRNKQGKSANRRLRSINKFPAIIYGGKTNPTSIEIDYHEIWNAQNKVNLYKEIFTLNIEGKKENVKIKAIQRHPFKEKLTHIDFIRV